MVFYGKEMNIRDFHPEFKSDFEINASEQAMAYQNSKIKSDEEIADMKRLASLECYDDYVDALDNEDEVERGNI